MLLYPLSLFLIKIKMNTTIILFSEKSWYKDKFDVEYF